MTVTETRVAVLLALMRQLQELMRVENGLLRDLKLARLRELQAEKAALASHYELELRSLRQAPEALSGLGEEARQLLERAMREFQATARANADRLRQARSVVEAVIQTIGQSIAAGAGEDQRYAGGPRPVGEPSARVIPMAVDRRC